MGRDNPVGPHYAGQPVILIHVMVADRAACADITVSNGGLNGTLHPGVPRVMCPGCVLAVREINPAKAAADE